MTEEKYLVLIQKKLSGEISTTEQAELTEWLNANPTNKKTLEEYQNIWKLTESVDTDFEVDIDQGFNKLQARIQSESKPTPVNVIPMRRRILQVAAALAFLLGAGFLFNLYNTNQIENNWVTITTKANEKKSVTLADGTIVSINQNSEFKYTESFTSDNRNVQLKGEAFFDVARDEAKPFIIDTDKTQVTVLGTSFNVREYKEEMLTEVMVKTGKVKLAPKNDKKEAVQLTAFKKGVYYHSDLKLEASTLDHLNDIAWHSGQVKFKSTALVDVLDILSRQLNCNIQVENKQLLSCKYTGNFGNLKLNQIANAIAISFGASNPTFNTTDQQYTIAGGTCVNQ